MASVLVVEDDLGLQFTLSQALEADGHKVYVASSTKEAVAALKRCSPDLLLLDLMLGDGMSTDVANYAAYAAPLAQIIFMTGSGLFPKGELFDLSHNARWVLRKPVDLSDLLNMVAHAGGNWQPMTANVS